MTGAVRYELWVWTEAGGWQQIGGNNLTVTTFRHDDLQAGGTFYYAVRALNTDGVASPWSQYASATLAPSLIAFVSNRDGNDEIYVMNADGSNVTRITNHPEADNDPAWAPDGNRIAFHSARDRNSEIYVMNADGSGPVNLTNNLSSDLEPAWSPDGNRIAFRSNRSGNDEIYLMNADASGVVQLTHHAAEDSSPSWSPNGSKIAFSSDRDGHPEIYVINIDGSGLTRLTHHPEPDFQPVWSPDGSKIAFVSSRDGFPAVFVMNADGSGSTRLTDPLEHAHHPAPAWSPDGNRVAFNAFSDGDLDIFVINTDGSGLTRLTENTARDSNPSWRHSSAPIETRPIPTIPTLSAAAEQGGIQLSWTPVTGAARYELRVRTSAGSWRQIGGNNLSGTSFKHFGLEAGTAYQYQIRKVDAAGAGGDWSQTVSATLSAAQSRIPAPDRLLLLPRRKRRHLRYECRWHRPHPSDRPSGRRVVSRLVARWRQNCIRSVSCLQSRNLRHERRRHRHYPRYRPAFIELPTLMELPSLLVARRH